MEKSSPPVLLCCPPPSSHPGLLIVIDGVGSDDMELALTSDAASCTSDRAVVSLLGGLAAFAHVMRNEMSASR